MPPRRRKWSWLGGPKNRRLRPRGVAAPVARRTAREWLAAMIPILQGAAVAATVVGVGLGAMYLGRYVTHSPHFALHEVRFPETRHASVAALRARAALPIGDNLFRVDLGAAERRLAEDPWVLRASLHRRLPDGVAAEIVEREPAAVVAFGSLYLVDKTGEAFKRASPEEAAVDPVITGLDRDSYIHERAYAEASIREAIAVLERWTAGGRFAVGEVHVETAAGITLYAREGGVAVRIGRGDPATLEARMARVDATLRALARTGDKPGLILADQEGERVTVRLLPAGPAPSSSAPPATPRG